MDSLDEAYTEVNLLPKAEAVHLGQVAHSREVADYCHSIAVKGPQEEGIGHLAQVDLPGNSFMGIQVVHLKDYMVPSLAKALDHHSPPIHFCL